MNDSTSDLLIALFSGLNTHWEAASATWDDEVRHRFEVLYLNPLRTELHQLSACRAALESLCDEAQRDLRQP